jgi:hypothetical protein
MSWYYTFNPPATIGGNTITKPGIADSLPIGRLGKYQLPYGPCWEASFSWLCYHEDPKVIKWLEDTVLGHFRHKCTEIGPGMTEWLIETTYQEVRDYALTVCKDLNIQIVDYGDGPWTAVRIQQELAPKYVGVTNVHT